MALGTVRIPDYLVNTSFAANTTGTIGNDDGQDFVESAFSIVLSPNGVRSANYTAQINDRGTVLPMNTASGNTAANATYTIPPNSSVAYANGTTLGLLWFSTGVIQPAFAAGAGVTIFPASPLTVIAAGKIVWAWQYSQDVWYLAGEVG